MKLRIVTEGHYRGNTKSSGIYNLVEQHTRTYGFSRDGIYLWDNLQFPTALPCSDINCIVDGLKTQRLLIYLSLYLIGVAKCFNERQPTATSQRCVCVFLISEQHASTNGCIQGERSEVCTTVRAQRINP